MDDHSIQIRIKDTFEGARFAVLSTAAGNTSPHANIVCYVVADDLATLAFLTPRKTRKFAHLVDTPAATLFVDDREGREDLTSITGIEARGPVTLIDGDAALGYRALYLRKYPELRSFVDAPDTAWCLVRVESYDLVHRFQEVVRYFPGETA